MLISERITRAGTPATTERGGTSLMTTALAPTTEPAPMRIGPRTCPPGADIAIVLNDRYVVPARPSAYRGLVGDHHVLADATAFVEDYAKVAQARALANLRGHRNDRMIEEPN